MFRYPTTGPAIRADGARLALALLAAAVLASCGGIDGKDDGVGGDSGSGSSSGLADSSTLDAKCEAPRAATARDPFTDALYNDSKGSLADEKAFLRSWIDETYLWYKDVRDLPAATLDPAAYATPLQYFAALKSPLTTASNKPKDQFHFTYDTPAWVALSQSGIEFGYGVEFALTRSTVPRSAVVAYTEPTPLGGAAPAITRGTAILAVDGIDLVNDTTATGIETLNAGLFPSTAGDHVFIVRDLGATMTRTVTLKAAQVTKTPVQNVKVLPVPNDKVGYLLFNDHIATSETQLIDGVTTLKNAGVTDLVLDLRYNGGGLLAIASELAYMIAGPDKTNGKAFERLSYNDRNPFKTSSADNTTPFLATAQGFSRTSGQALPFLGLSRVFVLTGANTCSASESIINGLRGVGVTVNLIGGTTCGKPYGFYPRDNCNTTYFAIQFQGVNAAGFGDYADGFPATCAVDDDFAHALGDPAEAQLNYALGYRTSGTCMPRTAMAQSAARSLADGSREPPRLVRSAFRENRIYAQPLAAR